MDGLRESRLRNVVAFVAGLCLVASVACGAPMSLSNGVPVTGISGAAGSEQFYAIVVPSGQDDLVISISGGTGDCDLYVRKDTEPTTTTYDYRPYKVGNNETVTVANPAAGTWFVMLRGYTAYSGLTLVASHSASVSVVTLTNGVALTGLSDATGGQKFYKIDVPSGQTKFEIAISGGTGDCDLYVKRGALPTTADYDYRPFLFGNNETVTVNNPTAGTWYIMLRAYNAYSGLTLLASHAGGVGSVLTNGVPVTGISGAQASERVYRIDVPAGQTNLEIKISGGTGDCDLYVKFGAQPTVGSYDYRPFLSGNDETVSINSPAAGTWFIMLRGGSAYSGVTLVATYGDVFILEDGVPVTDISGVLGSETIYRIDVPTGQSTLEIVIAGGTGECDLYIRWGAAPTTSNWDYRPYVTGNNETVTISNPQSGAWYIMLRGRTAYSGVTLKADYWFVGTVTLLDNGVPVTGISGSEGSERFYRIIVPTGQAKLEIQMYGGTGDADLYIKREAPPTTTEYDYRPFAIGNNEAITLDNPTGGNWLIMIRGYQAYANVTLVATFGSGTIPDPVTALSNGVPVTGLAGGAGSEVYYKIDVPAGQASLEIATSGGTGDLDLYVRRGDKPTTTQWDYRPYLIGNNETVTINNPTAGTYFIMLRGYQAYTGVTLVATHVPLADPVVALDNAVPVPGLSGAAGSEKFYAIVVPASQDFLNISISGGTGDCDLYVKRGAKPTATSYDYRPYLVGNNESVAVASPAEATWYIMLRAHQAYAGVTLLASYGAIGVGNDFSGDPNCVALWRFEDDQVVTDSIGTNILTTYGVQAETIEFKEGDASARFRSTESDWMSINDNSLSQGFPTRSGDSNVQMSICFWMRAASFSYENTIIAKYLIATGDRSWRIFAGNQGLTMGALKVGLGTDSGSRFETYTFDASSQLLALNQWYHVAFTYRNSDRRYHVRVWDATADALRFDAVGTMGSSLAVNNAPLTLGNLPLESRHYDGLLDEVVVFKDVLTVAEIDRIRQGAYGQP
ncbi:MAG: pre-peptidase C-terminal domain-containing protein [Sedimentisphaerales bacterium]|jgi:hypothetical protein|nr:pre-peptidase C-terminal domain-containing protein [Sedimentisphaerales bacterium]